MLLYGPVDVVLPDGRRVHSDRPVTALCTCRRSRRYPICDTSHRRPARRTRSEEQDADRPADRSTVPRTDPAG
ncbi:CDGSH iron-sulfur domain-containing protein [Pseudonocardia sp. H11422]|uniref:CDGSH iron-sulfur domain-containing protein n=1 Tax=Pseudonocardia sp. H11422 TaxID=2835866 RepID=UPI003977AF15